MRGLATIAAIIAFTAACGSSNESGGASPTPPMATHDMGIFTTSEGETPVLVFTRFRGAILTAISRWTLRYDKAEDCFYVQRGQPVLESAVPIWPKGTRSFVTGGTHGVKPPNGAEVADGETFGTAIASTSDPLQASLRKSLTASGLPATCADATRLVLFEP